MGLSLELKKLLNMKVSVILIVVDTFKTFTKEPEKGIRRIQH